jgi:hypothetical protein
VLFIVPLVGKFKGLHDVITNNVFKRHYFCKFYGLFLNAVTASSDHAMPYNRIDITKNFLNGMATNYR